MERATSHSLVLVDELGTSTDPEEGSALAEAILGYFHQRGVLVIATTHHRGVARYVQEREGMINASVDLDPQTLEPTYRVTLGLPGRSYALTIADRLGLAPEIIEDAKSLMSPTEREADELLQELQAERVVVERLRQEAESAQAQAKAQQAEVEARLASVESARVDLVEESRRELQNRIGELMTQLRQAERSLRVAQEQARERPGVFAPRVTPTTVSPDELERQRARLTEAQRELTSAQWQPIEVARTRWQEALQSGDRVFIRGIPRPVEVIAAPDADEQVEVLLGTMRARIPLYQLDRRADADPAAAQQGVYYRRPSPRQVVTELDLRGQRVDDALDRVEGLLNQASLGGAEQVRIIHGRGTGALRRAIREYLKGHPLVAAAGSAGDGSGDGVTVVELK
jgi:DNA mismatch repair protein MutS2